MSDTWIAALQHDEEGRRIMEHERLILEVTESMASMMDEQSVSRTELAKRMGKSPAFITKLLRGDNNFTLRTLSDVFFALGHAAHLSVGDVGGSVTPYTPKESEPLILTSASWNIPAARWRDQQGVFSDTPNDDGGIAA